MFSPLNGRREINGHPVSRAFPPVREFPLVKFGKIMTGHPSAVTSVKSEDSLEYQMVSKRLMTIDSYRVFVPVDQLNSQVDPYLHTTFSLSSLPRSSLESPLNSRQNNCTTLKTTDHHSGTGHPAQRESPLATTHQWPSTNPPPLNHSLVVFQTMVTSTGLSQRYASTI